MTETVIFNAGDVLIFKKNHPCGENKWEVLRTGADLRLKCTGCGRQVTMKRGDVIKAMKK